MLIVSVKHDIDKTIATLHAQQKQVRYAAAVALTRTAQDLQREIQADMPGNFTIRRDWVIKGIRIKTARRDFLQSEVYSRDPFMAIQETGGTKTAIGKRVFDYKGYLAIPLDARRGKTDIVQKQDWPQNLVNPFILTARDGRTYLAVHSVNVGKNGPRNVATLRGKQKRETGTRLMYTLVKSEQLKARLGMRRIAMRVIEPRWGINFNAALSMAFATAK